MNPRGLMLASFVVVSGVIAYDELRKCHELPWPPRFIATGIVFGLCDLIAAFNETLGATVAIGFVLAMIICTACPAGSCPGCNMTLTGTNCNERQGVATVQAIQNPPTGIQGTTV